jgi:hypothetical protein
MMIMHYFIAIQIRKERSSCLFIDTLLTPSQFSGDVNVLYRANDRLTSCLRISAIFLRRSERRIRRKISVRPLWTRSIRTSFGTVETFSGVAKHPVALREKGCSDGKYLSRSRYCVPLCTDDCSRRNTTNQDLSEQLLLSTFRYVRDRQWSSEPDISHGKGSGEEK